MDQYRFLEGKKMKWGKEEGTLLLLALAYQSLKLESIKPNQKSVALDLLKTMENEVYKC